MGFGPIPYRKTVSWGGDQRVYQDRSGQQYTLPGVAANTGGVAPTPGAQMQNTSFAKQIGMQPSYAPQYNYASMMQQNPWQSYQSVIDQFRPDFSQMINQQVGYSNQFQNTTPYANIFPYGIIPGYGSMMRNFNPYSY